MKQKRSIIKTLSKQFAMVALAFVVACGCAVAIPQVGNTVEAEAATPALSATSKTLYFGDSSYTLTLKNAGGKRVSWSSSNNDVVFIVDYSSKTAASKTASITIRPDAGGQTGTATVTAKCNGKKYTCTITVKEKPKLSATSTSLKIGSTKTLNMKGIAVGSGMITSSSKFKWSTSNSKVVTCSPCGTNPTGNSCKLTAQAPGTATITCKYNGKSYTCKVTVKSPSISSTKSVSKGKTATISISNGGNASATWSTSNSSIVKITGNKKDSCSIKGMKKGTATITCKVAGKTLKCKVTVK